VTCGVLSQESTGDPSIVRPGTPRFFTQESSRLRRDIAAPKAKIQQHVRDRVARNLARLLDQKFGGNKLALAKRCGMSQPYLYRVLAAKCSPTIDTLARLAAALDVDVAELLAIDA
jgi:DNA-binding phage protein